MVDISSIRFKMIGICCVNPSENAEEYRYIHSAWDKRFLPNMAFLLDAFAPDGSVRSEDQLIGTLVDEIKKRNVPFQPGSNCILSVFYDLRQPLTEQWLDSIYAFPRCLQEVLTGFVSLSLNFAHAGRKGLEKALLPTKRENAVKLYSYMKDKFPSNKIVLIAQDPLGEDGGCWIPVMTVLDALRREGNYDHLFPSSGNVGYFSYRAFEERERKEISDQLDRMNNLLNDKDNNKLQAALTKNVEQLEIDIKKDFAIKGGLQPQHPEMIVGPSLFDLKRNQARRGQGPYSGASTATREATSKTAVRMSEMIRQRFVLTTAEADDLFATMVNENEISLKWMKKESDVKSALTVPFGEKIFTGMLELPYNENGSKHDIGAYIQKHYEAALYSGKMAYCKALQEAYDRHRSSHDYDSSIDQMEREKANLLDRLAVLPTAQSFCENNILTDHSLKCEFNHLHNRDSGSSKFVVWENEDRTIGEQLEKVEKNLAITARIYSNNFTNNLARNDGSPIKVIKISMYACEDADFETLIT